MAAVKGLVRKSPVSIIDNRLIIGDASHLKNNMNFTFVAADGAVSRKSSKGENKRSKKVREVLKNSKNVIVLHDSSRMDSGGGLARTFKWSLIKQNKNYANHYSLTVFHAKKSRPTNYKLIASTSCIYYRFSRSPPSSHDISPPLTFNLYFC